MSSVMSKTVLVLQRDFWFPNFLKDQFQFEIQLFTYFILIRCSNHHFYIILAVKRICPKQFGRQKYILTCQNKLARKDLIHNSQVNYNTKTHFLHALRKLILFIFFQFLFNGFFKDEWWLRILKNGCATCSLLSDVNPFIFQLRKAGVLPFVMVGRYCQKFQN